MRTDFRAAWRILARRPGFAFVVIVPLAIGIGFTTAIFSIANALLFRPLPFADDARLMLLQSTRDDSGVVSELQVSAPDFDDWSRENRAFSSLGAALPSPFNLTGVGRAQRIPGARATASLLPTLGVAPAAGRAFSEVEQREDAPVALVSHEFWKSQFGGSRTAIGRTLSLDGRPYAIVGILPRGFRFGPRADVIVPFVGRQAERPRGSRGLNVVGRLRSGVSRSEAEQEMRGIAAALAQAHPDEDRGWSVSVRPIRDVFVENVRSAVWLLLAAAGFLLLVACVNVSNLLLARAAGRRGEAAVRIALGASRRRLVAGFFAESLLLCGAAGVAGVLVAWAGIRPLLAICPVELSRVGPVGVDGRVLAVSLALSLLAAMFFGTAAGWEGARTNLAAILNESGRASGGGRGTRRFQGFLVALEVAFAFLLAVGSAVAALAFGRLERVPTGFAPDGALTAAIAVPEARYPELADRAELLRRIRESLGAIPGVTAVAATNKLPLDENTIETSFLAEGGSRPADGDGWSAQFRRVTPAFFGAMGIRIAEGREFSPEDVDGKPLVAVVSRELARRHWPGRSPIGMRIQRLGGKRPWMTVVGVAEDVRDTGLAANFSPTLYVPYAQGKAGLPDMNIVLRTSLPPATLTRALRDRLAAMDPDLPAGEVVPLSTLVDDSLRRQRFQMILMGLLAAAGIVLAGVGVFGLVSYSVSQQSRDFAIRLALGASAARLRGFVTIRGARLAAAGLAGGLAAVAAGGRLMEGVLPGTPSPEPILVAAVAAAFGALCVLASWLAAGRAAAIAPVAALAE